jgi:hypothetical protein
MRCAPHGGLTPPAPGAVATTVRRKNAIFAMHKRTFTRAAGVSPPWLLGKCTCRYAAAKSRQTTIAVPRNAGAVAVAKPRGADAPRSWFGLRMLLRMYVSLTLPLEMRRVRLGLREGVRSG